MAARTRASFAVASSARYSAGVSKVLHFVRAECKFGCKFALAAPPTAVSGAETLFLRAACGEEEIVVGRVDAVRGRSLELLDTGAFEIEAPCIAWPEVAGMWPVNSNFLIRLFNSSSSSQTVEGAWLEPTDSVVASGFGRRADSRGAST